MREKNEKTLEELTEEIIENAPKDAPNDYKMRYLYHELGTILSKNTEFFYEATEERQEEIYNSPEIIENKKVICRNAVNLYCDMAKKLELKCTPIEFENDYETPINHWAIIYENNEKRYLMNPIPDFYRIQMGFSTKHFCHTEDYIGYDGMTFDSMSKEYVRQMDQNLGYLSGNMYTEELLQKLSGELANKLGTHMAKTTDTYQNYYIKLLELMDDDTKSISKKLEEMKELDPQFEKNESIIKESLEQKSITGNMRKVMRSVSFQELINEPTDLNHHREGAKYIGRLDMTRLKDLKKEMLTYKFNFMMEALSQIMDPLTGYIENIRFLDENKKYFFSQEDAKCVHRHTVIREKDGNREYFMMFALGNPKEDEKIYCFYDPKSKTRKMGIEPLTYMQEHGLQTLTNSSLNEEILDQEKNNSIFKELPKQNSNAKK